MIGCEGSGSPVRGQRHPQPSPACRMRPSVHPCSCGNTSARLCPQTQPPVYPAPAGNTRPRTPGHAPAPVHPRACGEHDVVRGTRITGFGSSPRLRGTHLDDDLLRLGQRFIPAPAGNTTGWRTAATTATVHPAPAGNTVAPAPTPSLSTVHPRACGEHASGPFLSWAASGSSPRLRGTPAGGSRPTPTLRFIPAPAGNTRGWIE